MKEKILYLVIGILIGAMIATGVFMVTGKNNSNMPNDTRRGFNGNNFPEGFDVNNIPNGVRPGGRADNSVGVPTDDLIEQTNTL